jgi:hypothetical protein
MHIVTIEGAPPFDGTYEVDMDRPFNGRELHVVKELANVRLGEIDEALDAGDYDLLLAFAAIALTRAGKVPKEQTIRVARDVLMEAEGGAIGITRVPEADAGPPEQPPTSSTSSESSPSSSPDSNGTGDAPLETIPTSTGTQL